MKKTSLFLLITLCFLFCKSPAKLSIYSAEDLKEQVKIQTFPANVSIRAITAIDKNTMWYGGSKGQFGYTTDGGASWTIDSIQHANKADLEFRGIAKTTEAVFLLAVGSPALLFKSTDMGKNWTVVYEESHPTAFYDAIAFWDDKNGIAMGDPTDGCLSIILTKDGGNTWAKIPCVQLPPTVDGEAAFAASNSNIALVENHAWIVSGGKKARVFHSPNRGKTWEVFNTPIAQGGKMTGIFTVDFYDENQGVIFGGDWEKQAQNTQNKAITSDGGQTWQLIADGQHPAYRSSVKYMPNSDGNALFAVGIPGVSYSDDGGQHWLSLSDDDFYTIRICEDSKTAWLAGRHKIGKMTWHKTAYEKEETASIASKNGEWLKAAQLFEQLYIKDLNNEEMNYQVGTNYLRANYPYKALSILNNFDKKYENKTADFNGRVARIAKAYYQIGEFQKIEKLVENYDYPKMYRGLAREHLKGLIQLNKTRELSTYFEAYQQKGIYDDKGKKTNTGFLYRAICNELLLVNNGNSLKIYAEKYRNWATQHQAKDKRNLAIAIFYQQDYTPAIIALKDAIANEKSPRHAMEMEGLLGICYAKNKEIAKAKAQIQKMLSLEDLPNRHDAFGAAFYHQARIEVALNQQKNAIQSLKKAIAAKAAFWSNRFKEDGLLKDLFGNETFEQLVKMN